MKKKILRTVCIVSAVVALAAAVALVWYFVNSDTATLPQRTSSVFTLASDDFDLPKNPVDFTSLTKRNSDVYAWIKIPNTQIDYPILQSYSEDDSFYLTHNIDKNYDINGSIYTEKQNSLDFSDPNTVIYGHNMLDGSMFQNLHLFRDKSFFDANKYIYIYTKNRILTYEIVAAYKSDNKHILNSYDFSDKQVFAEYIKSVKSPKSMEVNTRERDITTSDKLITLSTCIGNESNYRYLVQGVLIDDTRTQ